MKARDLVLALWFMSGKNWELTYEMVKYKMPMTIEKIDEVLDGVDRSAYITILDEDYPVEYRRGCKCPPFVLER